jgi:glycosyl transferase family 87
MSATRQDVEGLRPGSFQGRLLSILSYRPDVDGRVLVVTVLGIYFLVVALPRLVWGADIWRFLGVPTGPSLFFDTRNLTAALECRRLGYDPLRESPCDPWGRPLNYPRIWLALRWLALNQSHTDLLAIVLIALFLLSIFLVIGRVTFGEGVLVAMAVCSPSVMFAIERGNMDIVIFALLAGAVLVWRTDTAWGEAASPLIVLLAATAKIYPVFALLAFLLMRRRLAALVALGCATVFGFYVLVTFDDIAAVARIAPQGDEHSFGARILPAAIYHRFVPDRFQGGALRKQLLAIVPVLVAAPLMWMIGRRRQPENDTGAASSTRLAFLTGAFVFLGTFAVGNNFDYRLVFLLLMLPQLMEWARASQGEPRGWLAGFALVSMLLLLWIGALSRPLARWDELATWLLVGLVGVLVVASMPPPRSMWGVLRRPERA